MSVVRVSVSILLLLVQSALCQDSNHPTCDALIADTCFPDVYQNLLCHLNNNATSSRQCWKRSPTDLCIGLDDAFNCTADIIDDSCSDEEGRGSFDAWLAGFRAVRRYMCDNDAAKMSELLGFSDCWNLLTYLNCTEGLAGVSDVKSLLKVRLSAWECRRLDTALSLCNSHDVTNSPTCASLPDYLRQLLKIFLSAAGCPVKEAATKHSKPMPTEVAKPASVTGWVITVTILVILCGALIATLVIISYKRCTVRGGLRLLEAVDE